MTKQASASSNLQREYSNSKHTNINQERKLCIRKDSKNSTISLIKHFILKRSVKYYTNYDGLYNNMRMTIKDSKKILKEAF